MTFANAPAMLLFFGSAAVLSIILTPLFRSAAKRFGLVDAPDGRRKHQKHAVPLAGGISVFFSMLFSIVLLLVIPTSLRDSVIDDARLLPLLGAVMLIALVGLFDDAKGIRGRHKLLGQLLAISLLHNAEVLRIEHIEFLGTTINLGAFAPLFWVVWLLGCINAINLIDGMDGMLGIVGILICFTIATVCVITGQWLVAILATCLAGSLVGFLFYNLPPASVYLGDCGSMIIGLLIGVFSLSCASRGSNVVTLAIPLALLVLPFFDTFAAIVRRKLTGRSIYVTDRGHLHHCLQRRFNRPSVLLLMVGFGSITSLGVILTAVTGNDLYAVVSAFSVISVLIVARLFGHPELNLIRKRIMASFAASVAGKRADGSRALQVQLQGTARWNLVWDRLTQAVDHLNFRSLCLDVNVPSLHENYHARWDRVGSSNDDPRNWKAEVPLMLDGQVIGKLAATGIPDVLSLGENLAHLLRMVDDAERNAFSVTQHHRPVLSNFPTPMFHEGELAVVASS